MKEGGCRVQDLGGAERALPLLTLANPGQRNPPPPNGEETEAWANYTGPLRPDPSLIHFSPPDPVRPSQPWHPGAGDDSDDGLMSSSPSQPWTGGRLSVVPLGLARGQPCFRGLASGRKRGYGGGRAGQWGGGWRGASGQLMKGPIDGWVVEWGRSGLPVVPHPPQFRGLRPAPSCLAGVPWAASTPWGPKIQLLLLSGSQTSRRLGAGGCMVFQELREQPHNVAQDNQTHSLPTVQAGVWALVSGPCTLGGSGKELSLPVRHLGLLAVWGILVLQQHH